MFSKYTRQRKRLYYWQMGDNHPSGFSKNFGDEFSNILAQRLATKKNNIDRAQGSDLGKILAVGSILHFAKPFDIVWGSGINGKAIQDTRRALNDNNAAYKMNFLAVRGPLSQKIIHEAGGQCPSIFGDPGFLIGNEDLFPEVSKSLTKKGTILIPHYFDVKELKKQYDKLDDVKIILPDDCPIKIAQEVAKSEHVISTGLHGLIFGIALGTPVTHLRLSDHEPDFKFKDMFSGIGSKYPKSCNNLSQALINCGHLPSVDSTLDLLNAHPFNN